MKMAIMCAALALPLLILSATTHSASGQSAPPNIIVILADDMGYSDIGCYGGEIRTPSIDALAAGGLRFTQFYNAARCCPTRASLLTGLYPHQAGVGAMVSPGREPGYRGRLTEQCVTVAEVLRSAGYQTFMCGKWHVSHYDYNNPEPTLHRASWPLQRGFDRFFGTLAGGGSFYAPVSLMNDNAFIQPGEGFYYTDAISDHAVRYIREADPQRPLFLYIAHTAPHWPLHAPEADIAQYEGVYDVGWDAIRTARRERMTELGIIRREWPLSPRNGGVPPWQSAENQSWQARRMAVHAAMITVMDRGIGRVMEALRAAGRYENTLVLFLSDNGASDEVIQGTATRHGKFARGGTRPDVPPGAPDTYASFGPHWANVSNTPFREFKKWNHEGGVATPLVVHWPARIKEPGALRHTPAHVIDIMATAADSAGAAYPARYNGNAILPLEGVSLLSVFEGRPLERTAPIFFEHMGNRAMRDGKWKLVMKKGGKWELYDMEADRVELNNLAATHPERVSAMREQWENWALRAFVK